MMSTCGAALSFSMAKGRGCAASAATSAAVCRVLFLMLPAPQGMYFSPLPCPNCCSVTAPASAGRASSGCKATKYCSTPVCTGAAASCAGEGADAASAALSADDSATRLSTACCPRCSRVCAAGTGAARKAASTSAALRAKMHRAANSTAACKKGTALLCPAGRRQGSLLRMARPPFFTPSASRAAAR